jgi:hypothetical protein
MEAQIDPCHRRHARSIPRREAPEICIINNQLIVGTVAAVSPHSHSIVSAHRNVLNFKRYLFPGAAKDRLGSPSKTRALDFKSEFGRSAICSVSVTIDNAWSIFQINCKGLSSWPSQKRPSAMTEGCEPIGRTKIYRSYRYIFALRALESVHPARHTSLPNALYPHR